MSDVIAEQTPAVDDPAQGRGGLWGFLTFWGLHAWVVAYSVVMLSAFYIQFGQESSPARCACCSATG